MTEWRLRKAPQLLLKKNLSKTPTVPQLCVLGYFFFYLLIHKDFGLSFNTESQKGRDAGSLRSNEYCIELFCGSTEEPEHRELQYRRLQTVSHHLSFQPTSHACVIFSPSLDMLTPVLSIVALTPLYLINSNKCWLFFNASVSRVLSKKDKASCEPLQTEQGKALATPRKQTVITGTPTTVFPKSTGRQTND